MPVITSLKAEIVRVRTVDGARWRLEQIAVDDRGGVTRATVTERSDARAILADALEIERQGVRVDRAGLAR